MIWFAVYVALIFAANWAVMTFGIVPLFFWPAVAAPAGVYFAGLTFAARNQLQESKGRVWSVVAIPLGAAFSFLISPHFALASGATFLLSETADWLVYSHIRKRGRPLAMLASCIAADVVDSAVFLALAFGSLDHIEGQIAGKWAVVVPIVVGMALWRRRADNIPQYA
jgi:hypothetical protein